MKTTSVKGTSDYLPVEMQLRDEMQRIILDTYLSNGFMHVSTPALEDMENLDKSEGGDNLNLIFKILKRGEKLEEAINNKNFEDLSDIGLRYDLTLPLARFYSNNKEKLPLPFKCVQIDRVYRAERPQKGRLREFMQCDVDILGSDSNICEIELILTVTEALNKLGICDYRVRINDRNILKAMLNSLGFNEKDFDSICISMDKFDKIGGKGVFDELCEKGQNKDIVSKLINVLENGLTLDSIKTIIGDTSIISNLEDIISKVKSITNGAFDIVFDGTLVRGQGYYTGTVFEIDSSEFSCAVAGGGRYDNLISKFTGEKIPAVGFSIGFERIFSILNSKNKSMVSRPKLALFCNNDCFEDCIKYSNILKKDYDVSVLIQPNKLGKYLNKLKEFGFNNFCNYCESKEIKPIN